MKKVLSILLCVCLLATTVLTVPMVSAEEQPEVKEYFYHFNDFESLANDEAWLAAAKQGTTMSVENGSNIISGNQSLKVTSAGNGYNGFALSNVGVPVNLSTRVSFDYKITVGTKGWSGVGYIGHSSATNSAGVAGVQCYNWANVNEGAYSNVVNIGEQTASTTKRSFKNIITRNDKGNSQPIGIFYNDNKAASEVIFDNLVIAEIIETVAVANSDETKGTVTVANKAGHSNYAVNETAVFTATPAEGYSLKGWYNGDELISTEATYEHTLTGDTTLTAKWKLYEKEYQYIECDYENLTDYENWFSAASDCGMSLETENSISGSTSLKVTAGKTGYIGFPVIPTSTNLKTSTNYRISGSAKVTAGSFSLGRIGSVNINDGKANPWDIGTGTPGNGSVPFDLLASWSSHTSTMAVKKGTGILTTKTTKLGSIFLVESVDSNNTASILIDDIIIAEIIDTVTAVSSDETKGAVTVANKAGYNNYAKNEIAVFTAVPNNGYYLEGWYNANGEKVSTDKVYEATLTTDTNLTAKFAAYDTLYTISFNTNGGNEIESVSNGAGADFAPETPVKDGYVFAGWYADANCTTPFTATTFPAEDITIYAKWVNGSYQDFENYEGTPSGNFEVLTDDENAYLGNGYLKYSADAKDGGSCVVVSDEALKDFAFPGDKIEVSFKYKLVSGDARFYMHTSVNSKTPSLAPNEATTWLNVYEYKNTNLVVSEDWQTVTAIVDLKNYAKATAEGFTVDNYLYSIIFLSSTNGAELYIDEVTLSTVPGTFVKTAYNNAAALRSAEASSTGKNGLRIYNEIDTHWVEDKNIVEYGSIAAFASNINGEITVENGNKGIAYSDGTLSAEKLSAWEVTEHTVVFTSYLTNIGTLRYGEDILIRSYAIAADGTVYYGKTATVSVFDVANAIDNAQTADGSEVSAEDSNAFYAFVNSANNAAYQAWCTENGKTLGALYSAKY